MAGLYSRRVVTPRGVGPACLLFAGKRIAAVLPAPPRSEPVEDLGEAWVLPGLLDTHTHGAAGVGAEELDAPALARLAAAYARHGVTGFFLSTLARPAPVLREVLRRAAALPDPPGARFLGVHLEGPFLNPRRAGGHAPAWCRPADPREARGYLEAGAGRLRSVTLAPEMDPEFRVLRLFARAGVVVTLGHSEADAATAAAARAAGARGVAHLFHAMPPFHHRAPGLVGAALTEPDLFVELIADGVHAAAEALCLAVRARGPEGCVLVSDSLPPTGLPPGEYRYAGGRVRVDAGEARTPAGRLAGSLTPLLVGVRRFARATGLGLAEAWAGGSAVPARAYRLRDQGRLVPGARADLVVLTGGEVVRTYVGGRLVWRRP